MFQVRFFITVKKNYRSVAYHNWSHGFHVANSIYSILKASTGIFRPLEVPSQPIGFQVSKPITVGDPKLRGSLSAN
jgi:hypothetical protein